MKDVGVSNDSFIIKFANTNYLSTSELSNVSKIWMIFDF